MKLTLDALKGAGSFTGRPVEKEIKWRQDGTDYTATVYVRPMGYQTAVSDVLSATGRQDSIAGRIAASICDEHGNPVFDSSLDITHGPLDPVELEKDPESTKRLGSLDGALTVALLFAIQEVNDLGKTKSSPSETKSGTNLSSPASGARRSRKPRKT
ncbi:phage tail assembly chaperone family protein, TAC [Pseudomonas putida]|uniref:Phage tail protein n=1 Tax=Pseudomonas putida (strain ATCC 700007 / DSM 6899 / JCM 31910 / BCRC 17059 / LMG 24140 / F1) TaxID=351746 RepID=A5W7X0_PSEP1|nr:phage tail assembly chaperone family protein, TAC [Pseudomonas putida]MDD2001527.1 phage tail assembly chaperone family protein, TAC [Pseudomonas putida]HDS1791543.1 phage tail assembly chaperone family protein, TAC [Pseudomonas putida]